MVYDDDDEDNIETNLDDESVLPDIELQWRMTTCEVGKSICTFIRIVCNDLVMVPLCTNG